MKPLGAFERHLRKLMYLIIVKAFGSKWVDKTISHETIKALKEKTHGISDKGLIESAFEFLDFNEIVDYLFSERYIEFTAEQVLEEKLSDEKLKKLSREEIISLLTQNRKDTLWNKFFSKNPKISELDANTLDEIRKKRNDVMHQHAMSEKDFIEINKVVDKVDKDVLLAIADIENRLYTINEISFIGHSLQNAISGFVKAYTESLSKIDWNATYDLISQTMKNAAAVALKIQNNNYEELGRIIQNAIKMSNDFSNNDSNKNVGIDTSHMKKLSAGEDVNDKALEEDDKEPKDNKEDDCSK